MTDPFMAAATIECPACSHPHSFVKDSRRCFSVSNGIRRRRECRSCKFRFSTVEVIVKMYKGAKTFQRTTGI